MSEYQPTPEYLRQRAAFYRQLALGARNLTTAKEYNSIADVYDREADALEKIQTKKKKRRSV
jgi:hypothetical protein